MCAKAWARCSAFPTTAVARRPHPPENCGHAHFCARMLIPRLAQFTEAYPEIDLTLQVAIPLLDVVAEDADLMVRYGAGHYADVEHLQIAPRRVSRPWPHPPFCAQHGPFDQARRPGRAAPLRSPLEPWRTWFARRRPGLGRTHRGLAVQRRGPAVRRRCRRHGRGPRAPQAGRAVAGQRHPGVACSTWKSPAPTPTTCAGVPAPWTAGNAKPSPNGVAQTM